MGWQTPPLVHWSELSHRNAAGGRTQPKSVRSNRMQTPGRTVIPESTIAPGPSVRRLEGASEHDNVITVLADAHIETARGDKYEVLHPHAVGGMAELFLVRDSPERL